MDPTNIKKRFKRRYGHIEWMEFERLRRNALQCAQCVEMCTMCCNVHNVLKCVQCVAMCTMCCNVHNVLKCAQCVAMCAMCCNVHNVLQCAQWGTTERRWKEASIHMWQKLLKYLLVDVTGNRKLLWKL
jgi:hypothetical protein